MIPFIRRLCERYEQVPQTVRTMQDTVLDEDEKKYLLSLGKNGILTTLIDKWIMGLSVVALNAQDVQDIAELRGSVRALQFIQKELVRYREKEKFDPITGMKKTK